jgi:hypothetical protein
MTCKFIPTTDLKTGHRTVLGTVTETKVSPSGKTMVITVSRADGSTFTDRISTAGKSAVFTG